MHAFIERIKKDAYFRIKLFLCLSFVLNVAYCIFLWIVGLLYSSKWFFVMSTYYGLLSLVRIFIFVQINRNKQRRICIITARACGYFLFLINVVVSIMMFVLIRENTSTKYHEITVITLATYTFFALTMAIISSVKWLKKDSCIYTCIQIIRLVCASVSMVTLTDTMLTTFGENNGLLRSIILPIFSGAVSLFIILCAVYMIIQANVELRNCKDEKE